MCYKKGETACVSPKICYTANNNILSNKPLAIFLRRESDVLLEHADEIRSIIDAYRLAYLVDSHLRAEQQRLRMLHFLAYDKLQRRNVEPFSEGLHKMRLCEAHTLRQLAHGNGVAYVN